MNNLQKFANQAEYNSATHAYPNVSWITNGDTLVYTAEAPAQTPSGNAGENSGDNGGNPEPPEDD